MAFKNGVWEPEDDSVAKQLNGLLSSDSPVLKQARTAGLASANQRGLLNSSMGVEAGESALIRSAVPIASQDADTIAKKNLAGMDIASKEKIAFANIASNDREKAAAAVTSMANIYGQSFASVAQNANIPAETRDAYLRHLAAIKDSNLKLAEQLYGIDLTWDSPTV
jgi:hypothetical protein